MKTTINLLNFQIGNHFFNYFQTKFVRFLLIKCKPNIDIVFSNRAIKKKEAFIRSDFQVRLLFLKYANTYKLMNHI